MSHQEDEPNPRHIRGINLRCNQVCTSSTDEDSAKTRPEIEQTDKVEHSNTVGSGPCVDGWIGDRGYLRYVEGILLPWFLVWYALKQASEGVGEVE
jgi:hypothetical protein